MTSVMLMLFLEKRPITNRSDPKSCIWLESIPGTHVRQTERQQQQVTRYATLVLFRDFLEREAKQKVSMVYAMSSSHRVDAADLCVASKCASRKIPSSAFLSLAEVGQK